MRALREAFLRASAGRPTILPRLVPLGDVDESEWDIASGERTALGLPPAIEPAQRDALLSRLVAAFADDRGHPVAQSAAQALQLARELGSLLDELAIEGVAFDRLADLVDGNFASHWQRTLRFLAIVGEAWPKVLAERGRIDGIDRRTRAIRAQAARWRERAAGDSGDRRRLDRLAAGDARAARRHRRAAAGHGRAARASIATWTSASWEKLDAIASAVRPARAAARRSGCARADVADWPGASAARRVAC